jgi:hypothetical protein
MAYKVVAPASDMFPSGTGKEVQFPLLTFQPSGGDTNVPWSISEQSTDFIRIAAPTGLKTPCTLSLRSSQIKDWYSSKDWIDKSAIPPITSATRINAVYTENVKLVDDADQLDEKILPVQVSLNVTVPNVDNLLNAQDQNLSNILERALTALISTYKDDTKTITNENLLYRLLGVLKPVQFVDTNM